MGRKRGGDIDQSQYKNPVFKGQEIHNPWMVPSPPLAYYNFSQIKNVNTCIKSKGLNFHRDINVLFIIFDCRYLLSFP